MKTKAQLKKEIEELTLQLADVNKKLEESSTEEYKTKLVEESKKVTEMEKELNDLTTLLETANEQLEKVNKTILGGTEVSTTYDKDARAKLVEEIKKKLPHNK